MLEFKKKERTATVYWKRTVNVLWYFCLEYIFSYCCKNLGILGKRQTAAPRNSQEEILPLTLYLNQRNSNLSAFNRTARYWKYSNLSWAHGVRKVNVCIFSPGNTGQGSPVSDLGDWSNSSRRDTAAWRLHARKMLTNPGAVTCCACSPCCAKNCSSDWERTRESEGDSLKQTIRYASVSSAFLIMWEGGSLS